MNIYIPENPKIAINMLINAGFEAGVVGGCVRDSLMGKKPNDWDICTSAKPDEVQSIFKDFKQLKMGLRHGTIVVIINGENIEITTYRIEGKYSDGRRPDEVIFTRKLIDDLSRRDYTQNAIFFNEIKGIVDPFNGVGDINNKIIRCVGNADIRLKEDALRILRGLRFASVLDFDIDENTKLSILKHKDLLKNISYERISVEFIKMIKGKKVTDILNEYKDVIVVIIPELKNMLLHNDSKIIWEESLNIIKKTEDTILRLTIFFNAVLDIYYSNMKVLKNEFERENVLIEIFKRMKITNTEDVSKNDIKDILEIIKYKNIKLKPTNQSILKLLSKLNGSEIQFKRLLLFKSFQGLLINLNEIENLFETISIENECIRISDLAIDGNDLINIGIPPSKKIGEILNKLLDEVILRKLPNKKEALLEAVKEIEKL